MVMTISSTITPTAKPTLPLASWASFGMNGAPAAVARRSSPTRQRLIQAQQSTQSQPRQREQDEIREECPGHERVIRSGVTIWPNCQAKSHASMLEMHEPQHREGDRFIAAP